MFAFSDTLIFSAYGVTDDVLLTAMAEITNYVMVVGLSLGLHIRGVISFGKFWQKDSFFIGPAIDEAADWYEECEWMGISMTPSASFKLDELEKRFAAKMGNWFVRYDIPTKHGIERASWATVWPKVNFVVRETDGKSIPKDIRELIVNSFKREGISVAIHPK